MLDALGPAGEEDPEPRVTDEEWNEDAGAAEALEVRRGLARRTPVEPQAHLVHPAGRRRGPGLAHALTARPESARDLRYASMNGVRSPSRTRSVSPVSCPVRWSLTMR